MSNLEAIQQAIGELSPGDLAIFRAWLTKFDSGIWDRQFEEDVVAGRLDEVADEAIQDLRGSRGTDW